MRGVHRETARVSAFLINLPRRADRLRSSSLQLGDSGLAWELVVAVDGRAGHLGTDHVPNLVSVEETACWLSHQAAYRQFLASDMDWGVILEDDFRLAPGIEWQRLVEAIALRATEENFGLIQLGWISHLYRLRHSPTTREFLHRAYWLVRELKRRREGSRISLRDHRGLGMFPADFRSGAHGYMLNRECAQTLMGLNVPVALPADDFLRVLSELPRRPLRIARLTCSLVEQASRSLPSSALDSDITTRHELSRGPALPEGVSEATAQSPHSIDR